MKLYWYFLLILATVFLQMTIFSFLNFRLIHLDFSLLPALVLAIDNKRDRAIFWAFTSGILLDIFSPLPFGVFIFAHLATVILLSYFVNRFFTRLPIFLVSIFLYLSYLFFEIMINFFTHSWSYLVLIDALFGTVVGIIIFLIAERFSSEYEYF